MRKIVENVSPHQNVVDLYDVYEDQNGVHLVLGSFVLVESCLTGLSLETSTPSVMQQL
jgi:hypothetical protein